MMFSTGFPQRCALGAALALTVALTAAVSFGADREPGPEGLEFFEKRVRPVLAENCFACHNSASKAPMGALALDSRAGLMKGGDRGPVVVPGSPEMSLLIKAVRYHDPHMQMPPKGKLPEARIADLESWVKMGAPWPSEDKPKGAPVKAVFDLRARAKHWSFQPLKRFGPPSVSTPAWAKTPVDNFILAKLAAAGLGPAKPADRRTLIRRLSFDLIGLPPTPAEVDAFVADKVPNAYEKVVERLLASPHYGERWARHWLDLVRFAETDGHEFDFDKPNAWMYRDYVIRAFNEDVPYNQFVMEHVAGDLLRTPRENPKDGSNESIIATGFYFLGEGKHSPVDLLDDEAERLDNQIDVFGKTFIGLTVGCARCHDHKFDAISTKDYYALSGFLKSSRYQNAVIDSPEPVRKAAADIEAVNSQLTPALITRSASVQQERLGRLSDYLLAARTVIRGNLTAVPSGASDTVFEDFEKSTYEGWKATGTAFGDAPNRRPAPDYQGDLNALGEGFVNSHFVQRGAERVTGDDLTGTLTSKTFTIQKPYVRFLIGGGNHAGLTCMNLLIGGKSVRTAAGKNNNRMAWAVWDVREFAGKQAQIQIVDNVTGPWGNIGVDHIVFSDSASVYTGPVAAIAAERQLDAEALGRWVKYLRDTAAKNVSDPFNAWARLALDPGGDFAASAQELLASTGAGGAASCDPAGSEVFEEFDRDDYNGWFVTGEAFGPGPTRSVSARMELGASPKIDRVIPAGIADSGRVSDRLQGTLRARTFKIEKNLVLYRIAGKDAQVNLVIDGFQRIRYPIYGGLTFTLNNPQPVWKTMDVSKWIGHSGYIEILDTGRGYAAVDRILFADTPPTDAPANALVRRLLERSGRTPEDLARRYQALFTETAGSWSAGNMPEGESEDRAALINWMLNNDPAGVVPPACDASITELIQKRAALDAAVPEPRRVMAIADGTPENDHVHIRGSFKSLGDEVPRRFLEAIAGSRQPAPPDSSGRLALAQRMVSPSNPLLARVMVNRIWQHHFGEGLVRTPDDFGIRGEKPTHPELLDYLATELIRQGWSMKKMHRMMVLSSTYRMASRASTAADAADPQNRLLHRMPVRRLEAEAIRDSILAVSGRLDRTQFGPSVLPFLTPFMEGRGRPATSGPVDGSGRRSVYISVRRNFLTPMFLAFDYPIPFTTIGRRSVSTVPAQALTLMNNPFVTQQAELWAKSVLADKAAVTAKDRVTRMYVTAFARPPSDVEVAGALAFLEDQKKRYGPDGELRAWSDLCHVLFNVKELIFVN